MMNMVFTACSYLALAGTIWLFLHLIQACFSMPKYLKRQNDVQDILQDKVDSYEKYVLECEEKERSEMLDQIDDEKKSLEMSKKWKERRECLDMLKGELQRIRERKDNLDWDSMLEEELKKHAEELDSENFAEEKEEEQEQKVQEQEEEQENSENEAHKEKSNSEKENKKMIEVELTEPKKEK
ncbi:golgin subfamily A member 6-like protein 22 isoform X2 [Odontomachus brunneus]|nr:golgin subfamily A member 6-like protein 22 isoform X2 [Odontomachus brunneus]